MEQEGGMSIIVKGMKMPTTCTRCTLDAFGYCVAARRYSESSTTHERASFCPLVELPEKHGRLIDADAYVSMMEEKCDYEKALDPYVLSVCRGGIKLMPTIVEAEGEENKK